MTLRFGGLLLLVGGFSAFAAAPLPLPNSSYLGINKPISVASYNGTGTAGGGGAFRGTVSNFDTTFWCVDDQLYFALGQSGNANVIGLNQIVVDDSRVRYGKVHNDLVNAYNDPTNHPEWTNQTGLPDSAQGRYRMAAYLISQYTFVSPSNPQSGLSGATQAIKDKNNAIQNTIWSLTNNSSPGAQNIPGVTAPNAYWLGQAVANYQNVDMAMWAVVSWTVDAAGTLGTGGYGSTTGARQTFLVQVVPEPGFYGLLSLGLGGLFLVLNRRKKNERQ